MAEVRGDAVELYRVHPDDVGLRLASPEDLQGGDPDHNARLLQQVLQGNQGPLFDVTVFNAGGAIYVGGSCESLAEGVDRAREVIVSGAAREKLAELERFDAGVGHG